MSVVLREESKDLAPAMLALADGTTFTGYGFGEHVFDSAPAVGEVVFNTSMLGYQEILTDPSYAGQMITWTAPHIGNTGCNSEDDESEKVHATGMVIRDLPVVCSNFRAQETLTSYLKKARIMGICGIDTRALVKHLRDKGAQMGAMAMLRPGSAGAVKKEALVAAARAAGSMEGRDYVKQVSCKSSYAWRELPWSLEYAAKHSNPGEKRGYRLLSQEELASRPHVVAIDCGVKFSILRLLTSVGFRVTVVPATYSARDILNLSPDAIFLSNGPGDPATLGYVVKPVSELIGRFPIFGICLGHQILGQVFGAKTYKLKFGHRGGNHPVMDLLTKKVEITVQNHGFAVSAESLPRTATAKVSHLNLNDQTVEGLHDHDNRAFSVQYTPESSPGTHDAQYLFRRFFDLVVGTESAKSAAKGGSSAKTK